MVSLSLWLLLTLVFLLVSQSLLLTLVLLELFVFVLLTYFTCAIAYSFISPILFIVLFSIFVIESVIGLSALIVIVSYTGSDYISSQSLLRSS